EQADEVRGPQAAERAVLAEDAQVRGTGGQGSAASTRGLAAASSGAVEDRPAPASPPVPPLASALRDAVAHVLDLHHVLARLAFDLELHPQVAGVLALARHELVHAHHPTVR